MTAGCLSDGDMSSQDLPMLSLVRVGEHPLTAAVQQLAEVPSYTFFNTDDQGAAQVAKQLLLQAERALPKEAYALVNSAFTSLLDLHVWGRP